MRLHIEHTTIFTYEEPISEAYTEMRLKPIEAAGQRCLWFTLTTEPRGEVMQYTDGYGNLVNHFDTLQSHDRVVVTAISEVHTPTTFMDDGRMLTPLGLFDFQAPTTYAPEEEIISDFAAPHLNKNDAVTTAMELMNALYSSIMYVPGATDVKTTAPEALRLGRGVCQDFAHIMLAACRSIGLPARYVSGYLYNPQLIDNRLEQGVPVPPNAASHAWVDVYVEGQGWISLDPTHNCAQTDEYVRVATGRDYADVPPTRGVYKGQAKERLTVNVSVKAL
jgi:transglutaminase-like putative cysteine protease